MIGGEPVTPVIILQCMILFAGVVFLTMAPALLLKAVLDAWDAWTHDD